MLCYFVQNLSWQLIADRDMAGEYGLVLERVGGVVEGAGALSEGGAGVEEGLGGERVSMA